VKSKRILIVSNLFAPEARGGAEFLAKKTAFQFAKDGHNVTVFTTTKRKMKGMDLSRDGDISIMRYRPRLPYHILEDGKQPLWKRILWHKMDLFERRSGRLLEEAIDSVKPDLIISHNLRGMGMSVGRAMERADVEWIHTLHDVQLLVPSGLFWVSQPRGSVFQLSKLWQHSIVMKPYRWLTRRLMGLPDMVIGPTSYIVDAHKNAGFFPDSKVCVLENPLVEVPDSRPSDLRHDPLRLLFVGQLSPHKGVDVLIDALGKMGNRSINLDIVGDGTMLDTYMEDALTLPSAINVKFLGRVDHEDLMRDMKTYDAFVFPSVVVENCPGVLLEARAAGLPIIASDVGGVSELVDSSGLFMPGEPRALAQKIFEVMSGDVKISDNRYISLERYAAQLLSLTLQKYNRPTAG
jgi:glycosyltransferase involved in cell wall biosynthesis